MKETDLINLVTQLTSNLVIGNRKSNWFREKILFHLEHGSPFETFKKSCLADRFICIASSWSYESQSSGGKSG